MVTDQVGLRSEDAALPSSYQRNTAETFETVDKDLGHYLSQLVKERELRI